MKIRYLADTIIQNGQIDDDCLHKQGFNVNIEMFQKNKAFNEIILGIIEYMTTILNTNFEDYPKLRGISGANVGIPFNIVVLKNENLDCVFINPIITKKSHSKISALSNCGSVNLSKQIRIKRYTWVWVKWVDIRGKHHEQKFKTNTPNSICLTLQHEIEHNKGILIIDKKSL